MWNEPRPGGVAAFGECMIELTEQHGASRRSWGGDTLNTTVYLARLLPNLRGQIHYVTALGDDPFSDEMLRDWQREGIGTEWVRRIRNRLPGLYYIRTDGAGERSFHYWRERAAVKRSLDSRSGARLVKALGSMRLFYLSGISLAVLPAAARRRLLGLVETLRTVGVCIAFDSNFRARLWKSVAEAARWQEQFYALSHLVLVSYADEKQVFDDASPRATCERLMRAGAEEAVTRNGARPCTVANHLGIREYPPAEPVTPVDTTAAGDAFNAAYLGARLVNLDIPGAVARANRLANIVVRFPGAIIPREQTPLLEQLA